MRRAKCIDAKLRAAKRLPKFCFPFGPAAALDASDELLLSFLNYGCVPAHLVLSTLNDFDIPESGTWMNGFKTQVSFACGRSSSVHSARLCKRWFFSSDKVRALRVIIPGALRYQTSVVSVQASSHAYLLLQESLFTAKYLGCRTDAEDNSFVWPKTLLIAPGECRTASIICSRGSFKSSSLPLLLMVQQGKSVVIELRSEGRREDSSSRLLCTLNSFQVQLRPETANGLSNQRRAWLGVQNTDFSF